MDILIFAIVFLLSLSVHEASHAYAAYTLGDNTAKKQGRITLNPLRHLDIFGTLAIFIIGIGWAKPVPINPNNFENPRKGMMLTALAGPFSNLALALVSGGLMRFVPDYSFLSQLLGTMIFVNIILMLFNLIPIPPLDGSRVLGFLLPRNIYQLLEENGYIILIVAIGAEHFLHIPIFTYLIFMPASWIASFILTLS